jgi:Type II secretion system (T2SS), protein M subtype b
MSPRDRRALTLGGTVILAALLLLKLLPLGWQTARDRAEQFRGRAELLAGSRDLVAAAPMLQDSGVAIKGKLLALAPRILTGRNEAEAVADLSGRLSALAVSKRLRLSRSSALKDSTRAGSLHRLSMRIVLEGDTHGALGFLGNLASGAAVLVTDDLRIAARNPASPANLPEILEIEAVVHGWYLARESLP